MDCKHKDVIVLSPEGEIFRSCRTFIRFWCKDCGALGQDYYSYGVYHGIAWKNPQIVDDFNNRQMKY